MSLFYLTPSPTELKSSSTPFPQTSLWEFFMGGCLSFSSKQHPTAKLILDNGGLREFSHPIPVEGIIAGSPGCFICDADSMSFDDYLCPLSAEEQLQLDQIYFLLPVSKLQYPLPASDMAALAIKASAAMKRSGRKRGRGKISPLTEENLDLLQFRKLDQKRRSGNIRGKECEALKLKDVGARKLQRMTSRGRGLTKKTWKRKLSTIEEGFSV